MLSCVEGGHKRSHFEKFATPAMHERGEKGKTEKTGQRRHDSAVKRRGQWRKENGQELQIIQKRGGVFYKGSRKKERKEAAIYNKKEKSLTAYKCPKRKRSHEARSPHEVGGQRRKKVKLVEQAV